MFIGSTVFAPSASARPMTGAMPTAMGMSNFAEFNFGTDPDDPDSDHDSLLDPDEVHKYNTNPNKPDTDDDGLSDRSELDGGTDPLVNNNVPRQGPDPVDPVSSSGPTGLASTAGQGVPRYSLCHLARGPLGRNTTCSALTLRVAHLFGLGRAYHRKPPTPQQRRQCLVRRAWLLHLWGH
jgi:hypothetical protein